jgi:uncharacterized protein YjbI with pentapeptide repeats
MDKALHMGIALLLAILIMIEVVPLAETLSSLAITQQETGKENGAIGELRGAWLSTASFSNLDSFRFVGCSIENGDLSLQQSENVNFHDSSIENMRIDLRETSLAFDYCYVRNVNFTGDNDSRIHIKENVFEGNIRVNNVQIVFGGYNEFIGNFTVTNEEE